MVTHGPRGETIDYLDAYASGTSNTYRVGSGLLVVMVCTSFKSRIKLSREVPDQFPKISKYDPGIY